MSPNPQHEGEPNMNDRGRLSANTGITQHKDTNPTTLPSRLSGVVPGIWSEGTGEEMMMLMEGGEIETREARGRGKRGEGGGERVFMCALCEKVTFFLDEWKWKSGKERNFQKYFSIFAK